MIKKRKILIGTFLIILVVGVIATKIIASQLNKPVNGVIKVGKSEASASFTISLTPKLEVSPLATFDYPVGLTKQPSQAIALPYRESFVFTGRDVESWVLAIDVLNLPEGQLSLSSSYTLRKNNPNIYQENNINIASQSVIVMTDKSAGGFSKVAYLVHGSLLATVSLVGDDTTGTQPLQTAFNLVLNSWHWTE